MFRWLFRKEVKVLEEETKKAFSGVKDDMEKVGKWVKHLDNHDKQLFDALNLLREELASVKDDISGLRESIDVVNMGAQNKQVFKKLPVLGKQTSVYDVQKAVQTPVQTANYYDILKNLSSNERLIVFTLLNSPEMKLSYEDLAMLLGKERATVRGQINAIKQKSEGLITEIIEKNGKKRIYIPEEVRNKLSKYAKVRVRGTSKTHKNEQGEVKSESNNENQ